VSSTHGGHARTATGLVAAFLVAAPALVGLGYATLAAVGLVGYDAGGFSLARIGRVLGERATWSGLAWSAWVAGAATGIAAVAAGATAVVFRGPGRTDAAARALAVLALPVPHLVAGATALLILGQSGLIARLLTALGIVSTPAEMPALVYDQAGVGLIAALGWKEFPFLALLAFSVLATRGTALEETARGLGASPAQVLRHVTVPVLWRGLLPGAAAVFTFALGSYEAAALLAPSDPLALPLLVEERYTDSSLARRADAYVLVLVAAAASAVLIAAHEWLRARPGMVDR
jgi:putative spermidine/putrescine transport system permease protein